MKKLSFFLALIFFLTFISEHLISFDKLYVQFYSEYLNDKQVDNIISSRNKFKYFNYLFLLVYYLIKFIAVSSVIYIIAYLKFYPKITFKEVYNIVLSSEFLFLLVPVCKILYFYFFQDNYTLQDIQYFYPLSALNIIGYEGLEPWYIYPLQTLNLFEVAYIFFLAYQIGKLVKSDLDFGLTVVLYSYVPALLFWVSVIMFFTLNYS
jgi:hypothetical protein